MDGNQIEAVCFVFSLLVFSLATRWYLAPRLRQLPRAQALIPLLMVHSIRYIGLVSLVPVVVDPRLPREFSEPQAYGDLLTAILAVVAMLTLRWGSSTGIALTWLCNIVGVVDLIVAGIEGGRVNPMQYQLGAFFFIPAVAVPALLVSHVMIFVTLRRRPAA